MKKYKFSLDNVLNWRELQEEEAKKNFLVYQQAQREQEDILEGYIEASQSMNESTGSLTNINKLRQQFVYKNFLDNQIEMQKETVSQYSNETSKKMSVFVDAQKERKIMERLKEKHYENYLLEEKSEEQKELDEMGTLRFSYSFI
ncbi:MAG: flagellar export protein FliJ [Vagococcus sp.]|uniref:flagellar export protein FliJ n=1 Tax=Vagococcus sp. TaxID=1933889 RepID=UPI002FC86E47